MKPTTFLLRLVEFPFVLLGFIAWGVIFGINGGACMAWAVLHRPEGLSLSAAVDREVNL